MKSLSVGGGDEEGDLAEPRRISARVKNRNPTVPCWRSLMSAALVTELAASELPPLHFSIPPSPPIPLLISVSFFHRPTLLHTHLFLSLPPPPLVSHSLFVPLLHTSHFLSLYYSALLQMILLTNSCFFFLLLPLCSTFHCCHTVFDHEIRLSK